MAVLLATSPVVGTFHAALESSGYYDHGSGSPAAIMKRIDVRVAVSEAARAFPQSRFPGPVPDHPERRPGGEVRAGGRRGQGAEDASCSSAAPRIARASACCCRPSRSCAERTPDATLVVAGATRRQVLETERTGNDLPVDLTGVDALGWVADEEKIAQLGEAEILCAPSLAAESFGIVLAEAMAAGVPVVASNLPGYRAVLRDGEAGRLTPPGDPVALADALYDLLQDEDGAAAPRGRRHRRRRRPLVGPHHRQHRRGLRGRGRGAAGARLARPARQARARAARCSSTRCGRAAAATRPGAPPGPTRWERCAGLALTRRRPFRAAPDATAPRFAAPQAVC